VDAAKPHFQPSPRSFNAAPLSHYVSLSLSLCPSVCLSVPLSLSLPPLSLSREHITFPHAHLHTSHSPHTHMRARWCSNLQVGLLGMDEAAAAALLEAMAWNVEVTCVTSYPHPTIVPHRVACHLADVSSILATIRASPWHSPCHTPPERSVAMMGVGVCVCVCVCWCGARTQWHRFAPPQPSHVFFLLPFLSSVYFWAVWATGCCGDAAGQR
jgi:hypothetical protein